MKALILMITILWSLSSFAKIKVAVIDTGKPKHTTFEVCGTKNFSISETIIDDSRIGHGTNVSHLIDKYADGADYCQLIIKFFPSTSPTTSTIKALRYAIDQKVDIINYSAGGVEPNSHEKSLILEALKKGIIVVAAAGNEGNKKTCNYYPACYHDDIIVVGAKGKSGRVLSSSNENDMVDIYLPGENITAGGVTKTGTSQATAIATGLEVKKLYEKRKNEQKD